MCIPGPKQITLLYLMQWEGSRTREFAKTMILWIQTSHWKQSILCIPMTFIHREKQRKAEISREKECHLVLI